MSKINGVVDPRPFVAEQCVQVIVDHKGVFGEDIKDLGVPSNVVLVTFGITYDQKYRNGKRSMEDAVPLVTGHAPSENLRKVFTINEKMSDVRFAGISASLLDHGKHLKTQGYSQARISAQVTGIATVFSPVRDWFQVGMTVAVYLGSEHPHNEINGRLSFTPFELCFAEPFTIDRDKPAIYFQEEEFRTLHSTETGDPIYVEKYIKVKKGNTIAQIDFSSSSEILLPFGRLLSWGGAGKNEIVVELISNAKNNIDRGRQKQFVAGGMQDEADDLKNVQDSVESVSKRQKLTETQVKSITSSMEDNSTKADLTAQDKRISELERTVNTLLAAQQPSPAPASTVPKTPYTDLGVKHDMGDKTNEPKLYWKTKGKITHTVVRCKTVAELEDFFGTVSAANILSTHVYGKIDKDVMVAIGRRVVVKQMYSVKTKKILEHGLKFIEGYKAFLHKVPADDQKFVHSLALTYCASMKSVFHHLRFTAPDKRAPAEFQTWIWPSQQEPRPPDDHNNTFWVQSGKVP